jgi:phage-related holin
MTDKFKIICIEVLAFLFCFFAPIHSVLITVIALGAFDFISGILASIRCDIPITSKKMYHSVVKVTLYTMLILVSFMCEKYMFKELPWTKLATSSIAMVELKSIYENISAALGIDFWKYLKLVFEKKIDSAHKP